MRIKERKIYYKRESRRQNGSGNKLRKNAVSRGGRGNLANIMLTRGVSYSIYPRRARLRHLLSHPDSRKPSKRESGVKHHLFFTYTSNLARCTYTLSMMTHSLWCTVVLQLLSRLYSVKWQIKITARGNKMPRLPLANNGRENFTFCQKKNAVIFLVPFILYFLAKYTYACHLRRNYFESLSDVHHLLHNCACN